MNTKIYLAAVAGLAIVLIPACMESSSEQEANFAKVEAIEEGDLLMERWTYENQVDEMRNETTRNASIRADGWLPMSPELIVFRDKEKKPYIAIRGSFEKASPQMRCFRGSVGVKFDDGPIQQVGCVMGMAVGIDSKIFPQLEKSQTTWIEIETNMGGSEQFKFKTANLKI